MLLALLALSAAPPPLSTVAEVSGWTRTGRLDEVEALCAAFPRRYPGRVRCEQFGLTPLGRPLLALVASADGVLTAPAARARRRPVVLLQGGIHAGEIDGKDAGFWLLRELLEGRAAPGALAKVTLVFVPVFNVDGHERFGPNQRPNQRGPEQTGWRVTSANLNLNRDYLKAEAPEMQAMLGLLGRYDPILSADLHVTDGAQFEHDLSVTLAPLVNGPAELDALGLGLRDRVIEALEARGHLPLPFYPSFRVDDDPQSGFAAGSPPPRFSNAYWAARNRLGVLVETHSWKPFAARVKATFDACEALLSEAAAHGDRWLEAGARADAEDARRAGTELALVWEASRTSRPPDFRGYAYTREPSEVSGKTWIHYDESRPEVWRVPYFEELVPTGTVRVPQVGWLVPPPHAGWVAGKLALHGVAFRVLKGPSAGARVRTFRVEAPVFKAASFEGRQPVQLAGAWADDVQDLPAGTLFVPAAQARLRLALHLLEPTLPDSLAAWGYFNAHLEQKEFLEDYLTETFAREQLQDPQVKAAFEARLKDPAFAADPQARLRFFALRHPSADARLGLLPVYQATAPPP
jgi:Zinc carboxypeptidase